MLELVVTVDQNVIQISDTKLVQMFSKNVIDVFLKRDKLITQIEKHN